VGGERQQRRDRPVHSDHWHEQANRVHGDHEEVVLSGAAHSGKRPAGPGSDPDGLQGGADHEVQQEQWRRPVGAKVGVPKCEGPTTVGPLVLARPSPRKRTGYGHPLKAKTREEW
jgi:hypothetical protein